MFRQTKATTSGRWQRLFVGTVGMVGWAVCLVILASAIEKQVWPPFDTVLVCFVILPWASFLFSRFAFHGLLPEKQLADSASGRKIPRLAPTRH
jgi:hypothetical protein